ncbi:MAG: NADPH:quinone reductase [Burkholderiaceae bacterium]
MNRLPAYMNAAFVRRLGGVEEIEIGRLPVPQCGPDEVLARVDALAVNHVDTFVRSGAYATRLPMPFIIGRDFVGRVVAIGERVNTFAPGDPVWCNSLGYDGRQGPFAEYALAPADRVYPLPSNQDPIETVSVLHTMATACLGLFREGSLASGETVFIGGAAGGVGSAAVQLAAAAGARVLASASAADAEWVKACGASFVFDYHDPDLFNRIEHSAPQGIDLYWDNSGHHDLAKTLPLLGRGGRIVVSAGLQARACVPIGALYTRDASLRGFAISNASVVDLASAAAMINRRLCVGDLKVRIGLRLPLREAAKAHRLQAAHGVEKPPGRIVLVPGEYESIT